MADPPSIDRPAVKVLETNSTITEAVNQSQKRKRFESINRLKQRQAVNTMRLRMYQKSPLHTGNITQAQLKELRAKINEDLEEATELECKRREYEALWRPRPKKKGPTDTL